MFGRVQSSGLSVKTPAGESATGPCLSALSGAEVIFGTILRRRVGRRIRTPSNWIRGRPYAGSAGSDCGFSVLPLSFAWKDQRRCRNFMVTGSPPSIERRTFRTPCVAGEASNVRCLRYRTICVVKVFDGETRV